MFLGCNHSSVLNSYCIGMEKLGVSYFAMSFEFNRSSYVNYSKIYTVYKKKVGLYETILGVFVLFYQLMKCDVIHIVSDFGIPSRLNRIVAPLLYSRKGIKYFITFTGSDIRDPEIELSINPFFKHAYHNPLYEGKYWETSENSYKHQSFFATKGFRLVANPEVVPFVNKELFRYSFLSFHPSCNTIDLPQSNSGLIQSKKVRIIHAPTSPVAKGSQYVIAAAEKLVKKWPELVEFRLLSGLTNAEYQKELVNCDVLVDQLIWGWYGIASQQALELGKVVVCYVSDFRLKMVNDCPIVNANIFNIFDELESLVSKWEYSFEKISIESKRYYNRYHLPARVAQVALEFYKQ